MKSTDKTANGILKNKVIMLQNRDMELIFSPKRLIIILALWVFIVETFVMLLFDAIEFLGIPESVEGLLDATILTITLFIVLYFKLFKPLVTLVADYKQTVADLESYKTNLEQKVLERTAELDSAYTKLKEENELTLKVKEELRESEDRFRQIFENSEDAIILATLHDRMIIDVNSTAERIFKKSRSELISGGLQCLCHQDSYSNLFPAINQIIQDDSPGIIEKFECQLSPGGDVHILSFHGKRIPLQGTEVIYMTFRDITARIRLEQQALEIQARLIQANRMTSLGTMVSSVVHEINNPNNFLLLNAGIVKRIWEDIVPQLETNCCHHDDCPLGQENWCEIRTYMDDAVKGIEQGATRISDIVSNLKSFGRTGSFRNDAVADVNAVVQLSTSILSHHIANTTQKFKLDLVEGLPRVKGSARQLEQVVINLIQNSLIALPDADHGVTVSTGQEPGSGDIFIRVKDEGTGIPPEIAARIMEPFFTTRLERGGTGLGLAISSTIVKEYGGRITFKSEPGAGTTFTVWLCQTGANE